MPDFETMDLEQTAVYWEKVGDNNEGLPIVTDPVEIDVRWVDKKGTIKDPKGNSISTDGDLACDQELVEQSLVWLGTLEAWNTVTNGGLGFQGANVSSILDVTITPDLKARNARWTARVMRYGDFLPTPP